MCSTQERKQPADLIPKVTYSFSRSFFSNLISLPLKSYSLLLPLKRTSSFTEVTTYFYFAGNNTLLQKSSILLLVALVLQFSVASRSGFHCAENFCFNFAARFGHNFQQQQRFWPRVKLCNGARLGGFGCCCWCRSSMMMIMTMPKHTQRLFGCKFNVARREEGRKLFPSRNFHARWGAAQQQHFELLRKRSRHLQRRGRIFSFCPRTMRSQQQQSADIQYLAGGFFYILPG